MKIKVSESRHSYPTHMNEDGEFRCLHEDVDIEYDQGGDGITEPLGGWTVYCNDCHNDDLQDHEIDGLLEANDPFDPDWEYEQYRDNQMQGAV
jgi:hypothetical protein